MRNPNGYGSISKLSGKRRKPYMVRITTSINEMGVQQYKILGYFTKRTEAMEFLVTYNKNKDSINIDLTLKDVYEAMIEEKFTKQNKSVPSTYTSPFKSLEQLHDLSFAGIRLRHYEEIMNTLSTPNVKRNFKTLLSQMYKYAMRHEITDRNVASNLETPPAPKSTMHTAFTEKELKLLWKKKDELPAKLWLIYCYTGLRPSELTLIKNENVHLDEKYMIGGIKTEASIDREIPIADCILPFIQEFYNPTNEFLITIKGEVWNYDKIKYCLDNFCASNGLEHIPHDGRHTCATMLYAADINLTTIQNILGHAANVITSKIYIHKQLGLMLEAVNKLPAY